jgi:hypothetical protein
MHAISNNGSANNAENQLGGGCTTAAGADFENFYITGGARGI